MSDIYQVLGLATRARQVVTGDTAMENIRKKKAKLVIIANDASERTKKVVTDKCKFYQVPYMFVEKSLNLSIAIGKPNRMFVAILDEGFKNKLESC